MVDPEHFTGELKNICVPVLGIGKHTHVQPLSLDRAILVKYKCSSTVQHWNIPVSGPYSILLKHCMQVVWVRPIPFLNGFLKIHTPLWTVLNSFP